MAKGTQDIAAQSRQIIEDVRRHVFSPVYLLFGDEPYYIDMVCDAIVENALEESERDFNQTICYGQDVSAEAVISTARRYPMFAQRQLVVVRQAQAMAHFDNLALYCAQPLETTVLVLCVSGTVDRRKAFWKAVGKCGTVLESNRLRDYEVPRWIESFYSSKGLRISPDAAALLAEYAGTDLAKIAVETEKLMKNLPEGAKDVSATDIEKNVGISRQYSIFELTKELSVRNSARALKIAAYIGEAPRFAMPMAVSAIFTHFYRILKYEAFLVRNPRPDNASKARVLGVNPYFVREYDAAVAGYPLRKCMGVIAILKEYDYKGKGGDAGEASPGELLIELVTKILTI